MVMTAFPLFDSIFQAASREANGSAAQIPSRLAALAEQLVRSALTDLSEIEAFDVALAPSDDGAFDEQSAVLLRGMYEQWTRDADAVLERIAKVQRMGLAVNGIAELRDAHGRLLAMLQISLDDITRGRRQFRQGPTWTKEQIRSELGLGAK
jgi:hypothetical protein